MQAQAIFAGRRPVDEGDAWGYDATERWGVLNTAAGSTPVPSEQAVHTLEVLDAARVSAAQNRVVDLAV